MMLKTLKNTGLEKDIDWIIPHQASGKAVETISTGGFEKDRVIDIVSKYGNCVAASVPMALAIAFRITE